MFRNILIILLFLFTSFSALAGGLTLEEEGEQSQLVGTRNDSILSERSYGSSSSTNIAASSSSNTRGSIDGIDEASDAIVIMPRSNKINDDGTDEERLEAYIDHYVFNFEDPWSHKISRWVGKLVGLMAAQGWDPLTLFMFFNMVKLVSGYDVPVDSALDIAVIVIFSFILSPATSSHMGEAFESATSQAHLLKSVPLVNKLPIVKKMADPLEIPQAYKLQTRVNSLKIVHVGYSLTWAVLYTCVLSRLEHKDENRWFFWTFGAPYFVSKFWQYYQYLGKNSYRNLATESQNFLATQNMLRLTFKQKLDKKLQSLSNFSEEEIKNFYDTIISKESVQARMRAWESNSLRFTVVSYENDGGSRNRTSQLELDVNDHKPLTNRQVFMRHLSYSVSYGAMIARFVFFSWIMDYALEGLHIPAGLGRGIAQYSGAFLFDFLATVLERRSGQSYFESIFVNGFLTPYSVSNSKMRRVLGIISLPIGIVLAMSDSWYAWFQSTALPKGDLDSANHVDNSIRIPLLVFMLYDRLPMNGTFLTDGYNKFFSSFRNRSRQLLALISGKRIKPIGNGYRIDQISLATQRMQELIDQLNPTGVELVHRWLHDNLVE